MLKGSKRNLCVKRLHELVSDNVWVRPSDGRRYCKECRRQTRRDRITRNKPQQDNLRPFESIKPVEVIDLEGLYSAGRAAFTAGSPFDKSAGFDWQEGWIDAKTEAQYVDLPLEGYDDAKENE